MRFSRLDAADEDWDAVPVGDDMELVQPCSSWPRVRRAGIPGPRCRVPRWRETRLPLLVTHAPVGHQVRGIVDAIQRLEGWMAGMVLSSKKSGAARPPGL